MSKTHYFNLQPSEMAIFRAAADIYAGYIASGSVTSENEADMMKKAISAAIKIAHNIEKLVQSDEELPIPGEE